MIDQEINFSQEEDSICRSMHHLSTVSDHHHHPADAIDAYTNSAKRQSPLCRSLLKEPMAKRATLHPPSDHDLFGFTKIPLPNSFPAAASPPLLRRTLSEPIYSPIAANSAPQPPQLSEFPSSPNPIKTHQRQEFPTRNVSQESLPIQENAPAPAPASPLYRTVSDPNPFFNRQLVAASGTPPRPPRNPSRSPSCRESPNAKRLKRMKERLREMGQWWTEVVSEDDDEPNVESETNCIDNHTKEVCENGVEKNPSEEAVFVEKTGDCLVLHFKCPCGDGYQILLSGSNCYYKLTNFRN